VCHGRSSLEEDDVKALGDLPSKEELMAQIAGALNALATKMWVSTRFLLLRSQPEGSVREGTRQR